MQTSLISGRRIPESDFLTARLSAIGLWVLLLLWLPTSLAAGESAATDPHAAFSAFVDDYFADVFTFSPSAGTSAGFHQYDTKLEDRSAAAISEHIAKAKEFSNRLAKIRQSQLTADDAIDVEILASQLQAELLDLEVIRGWQNNPMSYVELPGDAINGLIKRDYAPAADRLHSVIARLQGVPPLVAAMRANVENPPPEFTELAIQVCDGSVEFFNGTLHDWAKQAAGSDAALLSKFETANKAAAEAMQQAGSWLKQDLLPRSKGNFALGADNFARKLLYEEMVDIPLDRLLAIGEANLARDQKAFAAVARQIDPKATPAEVMHHLSADHPTADDLISSARHTLENIRQFIVDHHIITIPSEVRPIVTETPTFDRIGFFASMDTPGAYETTAKEAFYYVTPVEPDWDAEHKEQHLRMFNFPVLKIVSVHEAFPGHFVQFLYAPGNPSKTRKLTGCASNVEGWAHYCEQMMVEEGFGGGDPKIQLAQLSEALLRDCRFIVAIKLHTQGMTLKQAAKFFETEGYQEPANAEAEAQRGAYDPTYLVYTLGKLQIYRLREDYQKKMGNDFKLENFHNEFIKQGGMPIKLIRRIMLPGDNRPVL